MSKDEGPNIIVRDLEALFNWLFITKKIALKVGAGFLGIILYLVIAIGVPWVLGYMLFVDEKGPQMFYGLFLIFWVLGNLMFIGGKMEV